MADGNGDARAGLRQAWERIGTYVLVLLLPALLIGAGWWEAGRTGRSLRTYAGAARELPAMRDELRAAVARDPGATVRFGGRDEGAMPASIALAELDEAIPIARRGAALSRLRRPFAWAAQAGGGLALLAGAGGLLVAAQAGRAARRSRDQLVLGFSRVHRALPFVLGALLAGFAVAIVGVAVFETISLWFWDTVSNGAFKLMLLGLMFAALAVYGAFTAIRGLRQVLALATPEPFDEQARLVAETDAPALWGLVRDVAARQGALLPDAIVVGLQGGFYVTEHPVRLLPEERVLTGRTLHLPAPYLELLDREELVGVVAHELGHFVGEDTAYSRHFSPIYLGLERALGALAQGGAAEHAGYNPAFRLGIHTLDRFDQAVKHWGRLREFEADRLSSAVGGARPIASALLRTGVIAPVVDHVLERRFQEPADDAADVVAEMAGTVRERGWPEMREHLDHRSPHPTDTHPSTPQRIERLALPLDDALVAQATRPPADPADTPGAQLFADWLATRRRLSDDFTARARSAHASHRAALESAAAAVGPEALELFENVRPMMWLMGVVAALFAAGAIATLVAAGAAGLAREPGAVALLAGICGAFALAFGGFAALLRRRGRQPLMVLSTEALATPRLRQPLRWLDIDGFGVSAGGKMQMVCAIAPEAALPERRRWSPRTTVSRRKRLLTLQYYGIRGMRQRAFSELIDRYLTAARARAALEG